MFGPVVVKSPVFLSRDMCKYDNCLDLISSRMFLQRGRVFLSHNFIIFTNILLDLYCSVFAIFFVLLTVEGMRCGAEV